MRIDAPMPAGPALPVITARGVVTDRVGAHIIDQAIESRPDEAATEALIKAIRKSIPGALLVAGNLVSVVSDGPKTFAAFSEAIAAAEHHIHVETYIFADDDLGRSYAELLSEKRRQGVEVRVLYDGVGSLMSEPTIFDDMRAAGVEVLAFRPLASVGGLLSGKMNNRDHRKLLIVDGRIAFAGGINISGTYNHGSSLRPGRDKGLDDGWRDAEVRVEGPAVQHFQALFFAAWANAGGKLDTVSPGYFPPLAPAGSQLMAVVASEYGDDSEAAIYLTYLAAMRNAKRRLWITQAYFAPDKAIREALVAAVERGVDTRILVPGFSDSGFTFHASRTIYDELLQGGVRIFELQDAFVHAKTAVVDSVVSFVGSANMDIRSFVHNNEVTAVIVDSVRNCPTSIGRLADSRSRTAVLG